jgi:hypothetical protein
MRQTKAGNEQQVGAADDGLPAPRGRWPRRRLIAALAALPAAGGLAGFAGLAGPGRALWPIARAQEGLDEDVSFFRIATGPTDGNYFNIGGLLASAISNPPGSRPCEEGGACGVPGLVAVAETSKGSVENIELLTKGMVESGLCQSDIAFWAYGGKGMYEGDAPLTGLRAIANLYQESLQIVVRADSDIKGIPDLKGKRVSLGERGSGTRATAVLVIDAFGLTPRAVGARQLPVAEAVQQLKDGDLDAFFVVGGDTVPAITELAETTPVRLLPVEGEKAQAMRDANPFLTLDFIPAGNYRNESAAVTVGIGTYWLVPDGMAEELAYQLTKALWHPTTRKILDEGSPLGRKIRVENALIALPIPLHDGAARYYAEARTLGPTGN